MIGRQRRSGLPALPRDLMGAERAVARTQLVHHAAIEIGGLAMDRRSGRRELVLVAPAFGELLRSHGGAASN